VNFDLYVWTSPRDLDLEAAEALIDGWEGEGGNPAESPFGSSDDIGWFHRELTHEFPALDVLSDAVPNPSRTPVWLSTTDEPPARVVAIRLSPANARDELHSIFGLATKYDLVVLDARNRRVHLPLSEMAEYASATFWPAGAIQAAVAGGAGGLIAVAAWLMGIPIISGLVALAGGFMFVMAVYSFVHEGRKVLSSRRPGGEPPTAY
jgi:hypothetical protein